METHFQTTQLVRGSTSSSSTFHAGAGRNNRRPWCGADRQGHEHAVPVCMVQTKIVGEAMLQAAGFVEQKKEYVN
jgi:hypothetical protein